MRTRNRTGRSSQSSTATTTVAVNATPAMRARPHCRARTHRGDDADQRPAQQPGHQQRAAEHDHDHQRFRHHDRVVHDHVDRDREAEPALADRDHRGAGGPPDEQTRERDVEAEEQGVEHPGALGQSGAEPAQRRQHHRVQRRVHGERELAVEADRLRRRVRVELEVERRGETTAVERVRRAVPRYTLESG